MALEKQLEYFRKHQETFAHEHHGQYVLVHDEDAEGFFDSELEAYTLGKKKYVAGTFLIRRCVASDEETSLVFHSRVAI